MEINNRKEMEKMLSLEGKVALITGGGGVLGQSIGKGLGLAGSKVALTDVVEEKAQEGARVLTEAGIDPRSRPEVVPVSGYVTLTNLCADALREAEC